jgi:DNA processing protein
VDGAAHRGALGAPGETTTIAVLAHGLDILYPASHQTLAQSIIDRGGALVSEYPPGTPVHKHNFLERNRIIAGLSRCVVVAEAGARSGSLVTAHYAADYGRDVFVLASEEGRAPGEGGRHLLEEGARLVGSAGEILAEYGLIAERDPEDDVWITVDESELLEKPGVGPADLLELELGGDLVRLGSGHIMVRSSRGRVNQRT